MSVHDPSHATSNRRRRRWPALVVGTGIVGAATLTLTLLNPLGSSSAAAGELTAFDDCDALAKHMSGLAMDRILDSRRDYDEYGPEVQADSGGSGDRAVPPMPPMDAPQGGTTTGSAGSTGAGTAGRDTAAEAGGMADSSEGTATGAAPAPAVASGETSKSGSSASDAVGNSASGTNTQEAGVDEADLAKTDGRLLVTARDNRLVVMDVSGRTPKARGSVLLTGQRPLELLLAGDRAIVIGTADTRQRYLEDEASADGRGASELTTLSVIDLSNPDRPVVVSTQEVTARYLSARMTGDTVRLVLSSTPDVLRTFNSGWSNRKYFDPRYDRGSTFDDDTFIDDARVRLARIPGEDWLPMVRDVDRKARTASETPLLDCSDVSYPVADSGMDLLTVLSIDTGLTDSLERAAATALVGSGDLVYATQDKLFVATTDGGWNDAPIAQFGARRNGGVSTRVHSFDITGGDAEYLASGRVDGYLYGRWAMSEKDGLLRMVTTTTAPWNRGGGASQTGVVVLDTAGKRMREIGRVDGMGFTETVRAVRWFDDVAAIVTFRQTDPLYLVDLSRPESPRVRGELEIPGYSAYLHPIGDHRLLGIGQDSGLQVSNFDILDLADPQRTDVLSFGRGTSSPVENDPRGFVYLPSRSLAVLPVFSNGDSLGFQCPPNANCAMPSMPMRDGSYTPRAEADNGLVAVRVTEDGKLKKVASWSDTDGRRVIKLIPLADGRIVALDYQGVRIFDAESLQLFGSAMYR
ncbi:beta-propeller domain-containing protein [Sporichthya sp.]|uniref:beta-propeller domain-containing protein n=1 Tax=Sporichthya sp. TaxID=65475 RepID=UPI0017FF02C6|nr:beta-propeller domain-containing protein [Sporichthya sp.]MBA3741768.1 beta-propeller domain-containing protein [Sporichthya sp.]